MNAAPSLFASSAVHCPYFPFARSTFPFSQRCRIVNVSSVGGKFYEPLGAWYHATKFAVEGFSDSLRIELAPFGIDVVIIEPGPIRTEWNEISRSSLVETSRGGAYEKQAAKVAKVLARADRAPVAGKPDQVARKIVGAVLANTPRARYPVGPGAGTLVRARRLLPDAAFDYVVKGAYGKVDRSSKAAGGELGFGRLFHGHDEAGCPHYIGTEGQEAVVGEQHRGSRRSLLDDRVDSADGDF